MLPKELIRQLQVILDDAGVAADVRDMIVKFVISLVVFWLVLLGLLCWFMWWRKR